MILFPGEKEALPVTEFLAGKASYAFMIFKSQQASLPKNL